MEKTVLEKTVMEAIYEENKSFIDILENNIPTFIKIYNDRRREFDRFHKTWFDNMIKMEKEMLKFNSNCVPYITQFGIFRNMVLNEFFRYYKEYASMRAKFFNVDAQTDKKEN